jgi:exportin-7
MDLAQLRQVEALASAIYEGHSPQHSQEAQQQLLVLKTSADYIPQCQFILDNSEQLYAQTVACSSLEGIVTQFWNNFTLEQKVELRNYVLNYMATKASALNAFVIVRLCILICRITKLGWFDSPEHRQIIEETTKFLEATVHHHIIGLKILNALIEEMNTPTNGRTLTAHRKTAVSFRDLSLFQIFQVAITTLRQVHSQSMADVSPTDKQRIAIESLQMSVACLSFDFVGTSTEDSVDDACIIQVPASWRTVVQDTSTVQLFFDFYTTNTDLRLMSHALEVLVLLSSVRRSLFPSEKERNDFLLCLMNGIQNIMSTGKGLNDPTNFHEFCRLLGRLKANYQLSELVKIPHFMEWLRLATEFTVRSFTDWEVCMNSIQYLLSLWGRMVAALPYLRTESLDVQRQVQLLKQCVMQVVEYYITTMLGTVDAVVNGVADDPLEDEGSLKEQLERLPVIAKLQYETVAQYLSRLFEQTISAYEQLTQIKLMSPSTLSKAQRNQIKLIEGRFAWLCYITGAVMTSQTSDPKRSPADLTWDGRLSRYVFQLIQMLEYFMENTAGASRAIDSLEMSILYFLRAFKKAYLTDIASVASITAPAAAITSFNSAVSPGTHPLLSLVLSSASPNGVDDSTIKEDATTIYEVMGIDSLATLMNVVINKLCSDVKYCHKSEKILEETLDVFSEMISTYSSSKTLLSLESVNFLVRNHIGAHFPFLGFDNDNKHRIAFYTTLSRLVFASCEDQFNSFDEFISPNMAIISQLNLMPDLAQPAMKVPIVASYRDLRGITAASANKRSYGLLFDVLYPEAFALLRRVTDVWYGDPVVMTAVLKFLHEVGQNRSLRIVFEQTSANGILLFREISAILCTYGSRILSVPVQNDIYVEKYKVVRLMLNALVSALSGNYVNFGVFGLYNDDVGTSYLSFY